VGKSSTEASRTHVSQHLNKNYINNLSIVDHPIQRNPSVRRRQKLSSRVRLRLNEPTVFVLDLTLTALQTRTTLPQPRPLLPLFVKYPPRLAIFKTSLPPSSLLTFLFHPHIMTAPYHPHPPSISAQPSSASYPSHYLTSHPKRHFLQDSPNLNHHPHSSPVTPSTANKKKHVCHICSKAFTTSGHLSRHARIHTGERKHKCPFPGCDTRCSRQDNLQQQYVLFLIL